MKIVQNLNIVRNYDNLRHDYQYRIIETKYNEVNTYGIEIERKDFNNDVLINIERNSIEKISNLRQVLGEKTNEAMSKPTEKADKGYAFDIEKMLLSNYIGEISKGMKGKLEIINGELVFVGNDEKEKQWAEEIGIKIGT